MKGQCCHCKELTTYTWTNSEAPSKSPTFICTSCMSEATMEKFASEDYERVGQKTYTRLLPYRVIEIK